MPRRNTGFARRTSRRRHQAMGNARMSTEFKQSHPARRRSYGPTGKTSGNRARRK